MSVVRNPCSRLHRPHTLFYLVPPYYETAGYGVDFGLEQYEKMAELARTIQGKMIISINDHDVIQKVFKGLNKRSLNINYTVGGSKKKAASELLIWSW